MIANLTGDAYADIIMGAAKGDGPTNTLTDAGEVYVLYGRPSGWSPSLSVSTIGSSSPGFVMYGKAALAWTAYSLAAGRLFGNGTDNVIFGVPTSAEVNVGKVQVLLTVNLCHNHLSLVQTSADVGRLVSLVVFKNPIRNYASKLCLPRLVPLAYFGHSYICYECI